MNMIRILNNRQTENQTTEEPITATENAQKTTLKNSRPQTYSSTAGITGINLVGLSLGLRCEIPDFVLCAGLR